MLVEKNLIGYSWFKKYRDEGCLKASTNLSLRIRAPYNSSARNESDALKDLFVRCGKIFAFPNNTEPRNLFEKSIETGKLLQEKTATYLSTIFSNNFESVYHL